MKKLSMTFVLMFTLVLISFANTFAVEDLSGKVVETMNSGGYTYVNIEKEGNNTWVAVTQTKISVGQDVSFKPGSVMTDFTSKSLNRTFDTIVFSGGVVGNDKPAPAAGVSDMKPPAKAVKVKKAEGPDAYTVADLYEKRSELDKKNVVISGKVVKFSSQIMGKNWIHLQDGTGDVTAGTHDITVTSSDSTAVGEIVLVEGIVTVDKDFGAGYRYAVIVEDATLQR